MGKVANTHPEPRNGDIWRSVKHGSLFQIAEVLPNGVSGWFLPYGEEGEARWGHIVKRPGRHVMHNHIFVRNIHEG